VLAEILSGKYDEDQFLQIPYFTIVHLHLCLILAAAMFLLIFVRNCHES